MGACTSSPKAIAQVPSYISKDATGKSATTTLSATTSPQSPYNPGVVLLWHGRLHHGSPENQSDRRRRALQLHYIPGSIEEIASEERLAVYGSEGKDVTC